MYYLNQTPTFSLSNVELDNTLAIDVVQIIDHFRTALVRPCVDAVIE